MKFMDTSEPHKVSTFEITIHMMLYGLDPESPQYRMIISARKTLERLDDFISYNLKNLDFDRSCVFFIQESSSWIREIVAEYLVVRFGALSSQLLREARKNAQKAELIVPEKSDKKKYKQFVENCTVCIDGKYCNRWFGSVRKDLSLLALQFSGDNDEHYRDHNEKNVLVCNYPDIRIVNNSFFKTDIDYRFASRPHFLALVDKEDANSIVSSMRRKIQKEAQEAKANGVPYKLQENYGNLFLLYTGERRSKRIGSFNSTAQRNLAQFGFHTRQFVIAFPNCDYRLDKMLKAKELFKSSFNPDNEFYMDYEEEREINPTPKDILYERFNCPFGNERDIINDEIHSIVDGLDYIRSTMNILSLCCTENCKDLFFDYIKTTIPEYEEPDTQILFETIRLQWHDVIIPKINEFVPADEKFAMLIEPWTPNSIKNEINRLFNQRINFVTPNAFRKNQGEENSIEEAKIIVFRYIPCTDHPSTYPNSYDPYVLRKSQKLLEITSDLLFHGHILRSQHNLNRHHNNTLGSKYRRARGWTQRIIETSSTDDIFFTMNYDDVIGNGDDYNNRRVIVNYTKTRQSHPVETEPVVYELHSGERSVSRLKDLVDREDVFGIQFLSEIEPKLEPLVNKLIAEDEEQERVIRQIWSHERGVDLTGPGEIWRILLKHEIETRGLDSVCDELAPAISDSNKKQVIKDWANLDKKRTLPGRKSSRKAVLEYLGIPIGSPYSKIIERKSRRRRRASKKNNMLIDSLLMEVVGRTLSPKVYEKVQRDLRDSLDHFGIASYDDFCALFELINTQVHITPIVSITSENES